MKDPSAPSGFRTWWDESTLFARLPEVVETDSHRLEPHLSGADARGLADLARGIARPPAERLVLVPDPAYAAASIAAFRDRVAAALLERGLPTAVEIEGTRPAPTDVPASPLRPGAEAPGPERARPAPVPKRRRLTLPPDEGRPRLA